MTSSPGLDPANFQAGVGVSVDVGWQMRHQDSRGDDPQFVQRDGELAGVTIMGSPGFSSFPAIAHRFSIPTDANLRWRLSVANDSIPLPPYLGMSPKPA